MIVFALYMKFHEKSILKFVIFASLLISILGYFILSPNIYDFSPQYARAQNWGFDSCSHCANGGMPFDDGTCQCLPVPTPRPTAQPTCPSAAVARSQHCLNDVGTCQNINNIPGATCIESHNNQFTFQGLTCTCPAGRMVGQQTCRPSNCPSGYVQSCPDGYQVVAGSVLTFHCQLTTTTPCQNKIECMRCERCPDCPPEAVPPGGVCPEGYRRDDAATDAANRGRPNTCTPCLVCMTEDEPCPIDDFNFVTTATPTIGASCPGTGTGTISSFHQFRQGGQTQYCGLCDTECPIDNFNFVTWARPNIGDPCPDGLGGTPDVVTSIFEFRRDGEDVWCGLCGPDDECPIDDYDFSVDFVVPVGAPCPSGDGYVTEVQVWGDGSSCGRCEEETCPIDDYDFRGPGPGPAVGAPCPTGDGEVSEVHVYNGNHCGICEEQPEECPPEFSHFISGTFSLVPQATQQCRSMTPPGNLGGHQIIPPSAGTPGICFECEPEAECECPPGLFATPEAACASIPPGSINCQPVAVNVPGVPSPPCPTMTCFDRIYQPPGDDEERLCEPFTPVFTRATGWIVSDPDTIAGVIPAGQGRGAGMRCGLPGGSATVAQGKAGSLGTPTRPEIPGLDRANFIVSIEPTGGALSPIFPTPGVHVMPDQIQAVGLYSFINLPWNTDRYTITLQIDNDPETPGPVSDDHEGVWVCSCPGDLNGDPFTCQFTDLPVPKPDNTCLGGLNVNPPFGPFTRGRESFLNYGELAMIDLDCINPSANFFVTVWDASSEPWWQAAAGNVYAETAIISQIPGNTRIADWVGYQDYTMCTFPHCTPYMIRDDRSCVAGDARSNRAGYPILGAGNRDQVDPGRRDGQITARSTPNGAGSRVVSSLHGPREDFAYFRSLMPTANLRAIDTIFELSQCSGHDVACIVRDGRDLIIPSGTNLRIQPPNRHSVFVEGNLYIGTDAPFSSYTDDYVVNLEVMEGAWLGFIVQGDIIVHPMVGRHNKRIRSYDGSTLLFDSTRPVCFDTEANCNALNDCNNAERGTIQGVFFADGMIDIRGFSAGAGQLTNVGSQECDMGTSRLPDKKFIGEGTFVGWSGVNLGRDFSDNCSFTRSWNSRSPTESFIFRPDFLLNVPDWMRRSIRLRQEVDEWR